MLPATAGFFHIKDSKTGELRPLRLYQHQAETIEIAKSRQSYVVTTGTVSGKSMTYMIPIVDHILRNQPEKAQVRTIIVYPMNALINGQAEAFKRRKGNNPASPIAYGTYTGLTQEDVRQQILDNLPHILRTNYVMLE